MKNIDLKEVRKLIREILAEHSRKHLLYYPDETAMNIDRLLFESGAIFIEESGKEN